jgi:hypothetical protein
MVSLGKNLVALQLVSRKLAEFGSWVLGIASWMVEWADWVEMVNTTDFAEQ